MKSQFLFLILLAFVPFSLFADASSLARINSLEQNSLVIYELPQSIMAVKVSKKNSSEVSLDIATTTKDVLERERLASWMAWCRAGFPDATLHDSITLSLATGELVHSGTSLQGESLFTLLKLEITKVPPSARKRAGAAPMPEEQDFRPLWQPKVIIQGKRLETTSTAYLVHWPNDGSGFAKKDLILYFPDSEEAIPGFPYWIESPTSSYKVFVTDSTRSFS